MRGRRLAAWLWLLAAAQAASACETGVAHVDAALSVPRSLLANADVALLKGYLASSLEACMEQCCVGTYGACTIASFKKNSTKENCLHFNCRPLTKCKFLSSNTTDTFSFSSQPLKAVGSSTTTEDPFAPLKNDNTTIKPRKGVPDNNSLVDTLSKPGIKPRKGVSTLDVPHYELLPVSLEKSGVKPRKGAPEVPTLPVENDINTNQTSELISELEKVFADDPITISLGAEILPSSVNFEEVSFAHTESLPSHTIQLTQNVPISRTKTIPDFHTITRQFVSAAVEEEIAPFSTSSFYTSTIQTSDHTLPLEGSKYLLADRRNNQLELAQHQKLPKLPDLGHQTSLGESVQLGTNSFQHQSLQEKLGQSSKDSQNKLVDDEETEFDKKYKSSIHLVLSLVFGLLVLFVVLGVVAKRVYDGWLRRDYYRMNYLIDGIYNGED